ncbi:hypothetical protein KFK09_005393 [Dendrobium nobile]|uniref:Uncharacterized protein n=1 Tax=Dendrobium nobile TaxID=94219 RepID=A0A8T3BVL6_DENNO|nr:hypothetical protein KFK09_005393 [Dendrobium nobile]
MPTSGGDSGGRRGGQIKRESLITRAVNSVFSFVRLAEFEILFFAFFVIAFLKFKDLIFATFFSAKATHTGVPSQTKYHFTPSSSLVVKIDNALC